MVLPLEPAHWALTGTTGGEKGRASSRGQGTVSEDAKEKWSQDRQGGVAQLGSKLDSPQLGDRHV